MEDKLDLLIGAGAIGEYLGLKPRKVYALIDAGELPSFKVGGLVAARKGRLAQWLDAKEAA